jgi:hypothetical protein
MINSCICLSNNITHLLCICNVVTLWIRVGCKSLEIRESILMELKSLYHLQLATPKLKNSLCAPIRCVHCTINLGHRKYMTI